jgi:hypothetical protein
MFIAYSFRAAKPNTRQGQYFTALSSDKAGANLPQTIEGIPIPKWDRVAEIDLDLIKSEGSGRNAAIGIAGISASVSEIKAAIINNHIFVCESEVAVSNSSIQPQNSR